MRGAGEACPPPRFVEKTLNIFVEETLLKIVKETLNIFVEETPLKIATFRLSWLSSKACLSPPCLISRILKHSKIRLSRVQFVLLSFTWFIDRASW